MKLKISPAIRRELSEALTAAGRSDLVRWLRAPAKAPRKQLVTRREVKAVKRAEHREATRTIRIAAMARCEGACELCRSTIVPLSLHHLDYGVGSRRQNQGIENTLLVCLSCHDLLHKHDTAALARLVIWAEHYGYTLPRRYLKGEG